MDLTPRGYEKVSRLLERGVRIPNPLSIDIGDEVDPDHIAAEGVVIYPGCRLYGSRTVISPGVELGAEGPVTVVDCQVGPEVELRGGYFKDSVFLEKAKMGSGAQVREGCLLEEEASGAHCVGLKQTILFPFATLGSLINFCDCLLAGGTSRAHHSEVGSSYIHFNFTPDGDKATPSLFGDVPRGVMLDQPPIFLGGQGGAVGPLRVAFGTVVAAGSVLRDDVLDERRLVVVGPHRESRRGHRPYTYGNLPRLIRNNVVYLANLVALETWYVWVRAPFFARQPLGELLLEGALAVLKGAKQERVNRLKAMAQKVPPATACGAEFRAHVEELCAVFTEGPAQVADEEFLAGFRQAAGDHEAGYIATVRALSDEVKAAGVAWLAGIVDTLTDKALGVIPSLLPGR
jgi:bifunctional UDP-N-acetylglucosamine pyrophosphorylase/glucosamine-1-phosphate N-acetyltransferase